MTEHEHMPPLMRVKVFRLSPRQVKVTIRNIEFVLNREEVRELAEWLETAFDDGPQVVCEVVR